MSKILIVPHLEPKRPPSRQERKNVFYDETNLRLLRLLHGNAHLPDSLDNIAIPRNLQLELAAAIRQRLLPWFWSIFLHIAVLVILAHILFSVAQFETPDILSGIANIPVQLEQALVAPLVGDHESAPNPLDTAGSPTVADEATAPLVELLHPSPGLDFSGRDPNLRDVMLGGGGGGGQTDEAVLAGLRWLVRVQQPDGAWHFASNDFPQAASPRQEDPIAATAMALLAFQGFGVTPNSQHPLLADFARPVRRGRDWLLQQQNPDGSFHSPLAPDNHRFYSHALCTIAICELLVMTGDETLREPAQRAIAYCIEHQSIRSGGWRYWPDRYSDQSDVSVTGWVLLALKSGQAAGMAIPAETYHRVTGFLDEMMVGNQYKYRAEEPEPRRAMTAQALLCRILLGWNRDEPRLAMGVQVLLDNMPSFAEHYSRDSYYWFFATQTLYHYGGTEWDAWNTAIREELLRHQERFGAEAGSWNPQRPVRDQWLQYGRLYTTCMSLYILEVYYRHKRLLP